MGNRGKSSDEIADFLRFVEQLNVPMLDVRAPWSAGAVECVEAALGRRLPRDFVEFVTRVSFGRLLNSGASLFEFEDVISGCIGPMMMVLGTATWAKDEDQERFYVSRGKFPLSRLTREQMRVGDVELFDLLQVGIDGGGGYLVINVEGGANPFGFAILSPERTFEDRAESFIAGMRKLIEEEVSLIDPVEPGLDPDWQAFDADTE